MMEMTAGMVDWAAAAPMLLLAGLGLLLVLAGTFFPKIYDETLAAIILTGFAAGVFFTLQNWGESTTTFLGMFIADDATRAFSLIFVLSAALTVLLSINRQERGYVLYSDYFALVIFATLGMYLMAAAGDLITLFLGLEVLSISLYVLAGFRRNNAYAIESAFKYFLLGAFASAFFLLGIAFVYGATGSTQLAAIAGKNPAAAGNLMPGLLPYAMLLLLTGFGFKLALFPFHLWAPDVYQGAPSPVAAFMATGSKAAAFAGLMRVAVAYDVWTMESWQNLLWALAAVTILAGNIVALRQTNIKRMLAYSSIAHAGYMVLGLLAGVVNGYPALLFYLLAYTFMNIGAFGVLSWLSTEEREILTLDDVRGLAKIRPWSAILLATFLISLAGIPPTAGFLGKYFIFLGAVRSGYILLVIIALVGSMIGLYYYLRVTVVMFMQERDDETPETAGHQPFVAIALAICFFAIFNLGLFPSRWLTVFRELVHLLP